MQSKRLVVTILLIVCCFTVGCGANSGRYEADDAQNEIVTEFNAKDNNATDSAYVYEPESDTLEADYQQSELIIQIGDTSLRLGEATIQDFIHAGASFMYEDIDDEDVLGWTMNANQMETYVYVDGIYELFLIRADSGEEKSTGDCVISEVEVRFKDVDVLSTDINDLPVCNSIYFNCGVAFGETEENVMSIYGTPDMNFVADYDTTEVRELDYDCNNEHVITCQIKDGRVFCFMMRE